MRPILNPRIENLISSDNRRSHVRFDDFTGCLYSNILWRPGSGTIAIIDALGGQLRIRSSTNSTTAKITQDNSGNYSVAAGFYIEWYASLVPGTAGQSGCGLTPGYYDSDQVFWYYNRATTNLQCRSYIYGVAETIEDSGIAATTAFHRYGIEGSDGSLRFYYDGAFVKLITTNVPTNNLSLEAYAYRAAATSDTLVDYVYGIGGRNNT